MNPLGLPSIDRLTTLPVDLHKALGQISEIAKNTANMPVLVEVQRQLAQLPETMGQLQERRADKPVAHDPMIGRFNQLSRPR